MKVLPYIKNNLIAFDQGLNTLLGGYPDETLSSRAYRLEQKGKLFGRLFRPLIDLLFFWQDEHCYEAYLSELNRKQFPTGTELHNNKNENCPRL